MEIENISAPAAPAQQTAPAASHTSENSVPEPHTRSNLSTFSAPDAFTRMFLLAWAVRYIPRGLLAEVLEKNTIPGLKKSVDRFVDKVALNRVTAKIETALTENKGLLKQAQKDGGELKDSEAGRALFDKIRKPIFHWRGDEAKEAQHIVEQAVDKSGKVTLSSASVDSLRNLTREKLTNIGYSLSLFAGSSLLSLRYGQRVRNDIQNLFRESVAYEKEIPQEQITFNDITRSDNRIIHGTVSNYHGKLAERLITDSLFFVSAPLKSMAIADLVLGVKGAQMLRDTWKRTPTLFEDLIGFVNNKINPINGLGQPISVGEVFDLYQHYAQAYAPERAFKGVIEHSQGEGARWAGNQIIFQRVTELMNKTYAYKHRSIIDPQTGHSILQADFALPKFIYLLGHDFIDVNEPRKTLVAIELANTQGIPAVKEMSKMLQQGKSVTEVIEHYHLTLPQANAPASPEAPNGIIPKGPELQLDQAPTSKIDTSTVHTVETLHNTQQQGTFI